MNEQMEPEQMLDELLNYLIHVERQTLLMVQRGVKTRESLIKVADNYLKKREVPKDTREKILNHFTKFIWGY